jgi:hypothetical protein
MALSDTVRSDIRHSHSRRLVDSDESEKAATSHPRLNVPLLAQNRTI